MSTTTETNPNAKLKDLIRETLTEQVGNYRAQVSLAMPNEVFSTVVDDMTDWSTWLTAVTVPRRDGTITRFISEAIIDVRDVKAGRFTERLVNGVAWDIWIRATDDIPLPGKELRITKARICELVGPTMGSQARKGTSWMDELAGWVGVLEEDGVSPANQLNEATRLTVDIRGARPVLPRWTCSTGWENHGTTGSGPKL